MHYLVAAAVLPALILLFYIRKQDKIEAEPPGLILKLFLLGALTVIPAGIIEAILTTIFGFALNESSIAYKLIENFLFVALTEEWFKRLVTKKVTWKSPEFNYTYDGVVYAVAVSLGFAAAENLLYVSEGGLKVAILRALTAIPGHTMFAVFMGLQYALAKKAHSAADGPLMRRHLRRSLFFPVLIHGFYDFCISVGNVFSILLFYAFFIMMLIFAILTVRKLSREDAPVSNEDIFV